MPQIRAYERSDLDGVEALLAARFPTWTRASSSLESAQLSPAPGEDERVFSRVACSDDGRVVGFVGAFPRELRFGRETRLGACISQMAVLDEPGARGSGAMLLSATLAGEQDLTWANSATDEVVRMWQALGGDLDHARSHDFMLVLRPARWVGSVLVDAARRRAPPRRLALPTAGLPLQALGRRALPSAFPAAEAEISGAEATATEIAAVDEAICARTRLRVRWPAGSLDDRGQKLSGRIVKRIVKLASKPIGWYAYLPGEGTSARLVHLAARRRELVSAVFGDLADHARAAGTGSLSGRAEPHLHATLRERFALLGAGIQPVVHSGDPQLLAALGSVGSLLTELDSVDSEWWVTPGSPTR